MNRKGRLSRLESAQDWQDKASQPNDKYTDEQRLESMKHLAAAIAEEIQRQGIDPSQDPRLFEPLAFAAALEEALR